VQFQRFPDGSPILRGPFHHDFVDLALDEPARERAQFGRARPNFVAFKLEVAFAFDVGHHHGQHLLVHVNPIPAILYGIGLSCGSGERASSHQSGSQAVVGRQDATTPNYSVNHARSGSHSCSASIAPWFISISPLPAPHSVQSQRFSFLFAGLEAQPHPVAEIVQCGEPAFAFCRSRHVHKT